MSHNAEAAPSLKDAAPKSLAAAKLLDCGQSTEPTTNERTPAPPFDGAQVLADVWVLVVKVNAGHYRRRVFLSVAPAWAAARRAADRGYSAEVVLCKLEPVGRTPR